MAALQLLKTPRFPAVVNRFSGRQCPGLPGLDGGKGEQAQGPKGIQVTLERKDPKGIQ